MLYNLMLSLSLFDINKEISASVLRLFLDLMNLNF